MDDLKYCVYILYSLKDNNLYIGYTTNIQRRFAEHQSGNSKSTAPRRPFKLIFVNIPQQKRMPLEQKNILKLLQVRRQ